MHADDILFALPFSNANPPSNLPMSFRFPSSYSQFLRLRQRAAEKGKGSAKTKAIGSSLKTEEKEISDIVIRKRKITVPIHQFDNPYFNETTVWVDARYTSLKLVDSGRFGVVISAKDSLNNNDNVAIKKVLSPFVSLHSTRHILREIRLLKYLTHPNIVQLLNIDVPNSYETWDSVNLITPLYECNLRNALLHNNNNHNKKKKPLNKKRILKQLLNALAHMHAKNVLHRDVKSLNVLLDKSCENAFFCDLGEARFYSHHHHFDNHNDNYNSTDEAELTVGPKTILQSAPELFLNEKYDTSVDIWGIGCIAAEMFLPNHDYLFNDISARNPMKTVVRILGYPSERETRHLKKKSSKWYLGLVKKHGGDGRYIAEKFRDDPLLADFIRHCLRFSPDERMTAEQALKHPFLNGHDDQSTTGRGEEEGAKKNSNIGNNCNSCRNRNYDFKLSEPSPELSKKKLKELVWEELLKFHPEAAKLRD